MDTRKSVSDTGDSSGQLDKARRSFMWKAGAGLSAVLAAAISGIAGARTNSDGKLKTRLGGLVGQVGILKDENKIRQLHQTYESFLDRGMYEEVVKLFTDDGEVIFNGGIFRGKRNGVNRLYCNRFRSGFTGRRIEYIPGILPDIGEQQDIIDVMPDRKSARARFTYSIQVGAPIISDSTFVQMAHLHGEGIMKWWEGGTCDMFCVKGKKGGNWEIKRLEYGAQSKADYRPGKTCSRPMSVPHFSKVFPEDPAGPDKLMNSAKGFCKA